MFIHTRCQPHSDLNLGSQKQLLLECVQRRVRCAEQTGNDSMMQLGRLVDVTMSRVDSIVAAYGVMGLK